MLLHPPVLDALGLDASDFAQSRHVEIWLGIQALRSSSAAIDQVSLASVLGTRGSLQQVGGRLYLQHLAECGTVSADVPYHAQQVAFAAQRRRLAVVLSECLETCGDQSLAPAEILADTVAKLAAVHDRYEYSEARPIGEYVHAYGLEAAGEKPVAAGTLKTGWEDFDRYELLGPGMLTVIAGRPGSGKSTFASEIVRRIAPGQGHCVVWFSLEMSGRQIVTRLISEESGVAHAVVKRPDLAAQRTPGIVNRIIEAGTRIGEAPIFLCDKSRITAGMIRALAMPRVARHKTGAIVVDYLQLMEGSPGLPKSATRNDIVGQITRELKILAKETGWPVIALSQLSRETEKRKGARPCLADLRESGSIEQDADAVIMVYQPAMHMDPDDPKRRDYAGRASVIVSKNRDGGTGEIFYRFIGETLRFVPMTLRQEPKGEGE